MYCSQILKATYKVNLCVAFFLWREKKNLPFLEMEFMVQFCINTFTIIYLWTPQDPANVLELFSIEFEPKNIFTNFLRHQLSDMALWMFCDFFCSGNYWVHTYIPFWKRAMSLNKYLTEAWRKILSIIYSMWLGFLITLKNTTFEIISTLVSYRNLS